MYKYYIILGFAFFFNLSNSFASSTRDSIGIENLNGKKIIIHKVVAHDTYYSISRRYKIPPKEIMSFNDNKYLQIGVIIKVPTNIPFDEKNGSANPIKAGNEAYTEYVVKPKENLNLIAEKYAITVSELKQINNLTTNNLSIGQVLKIPGKTAEVIVEEPTKVIPINSKENDQKEEDFIEHTVASNETIYSIATKYNLTIDQLKAKNNLTGSSLRVGQKLLVKGQYPSKDIKSSLDPNIDTLSSLKDPSLKYPPSRYGLHQVDEKGTGMWILDPDLDPSKMLVLHRTAPIGTVIKITNPMTNRTTFAKVVGKFTENESTKDVIIVMTKAVADALGVLDKRFLCDLTYSGQEEE